MPNRVLLSPNVGTGRTAVGLVDVAGEVATPAAGCSVRRECLDHVIVLGETHLHRIMSSFTDYYNQARTHLALGKDVPVGRSIEPSGPITAESMVADFHHCYTRI